MSLPNANLIASSRKAAAQMATRDTSFIFNEWYVAAFAEEVGRELLARTLLGKRVVLYRTLAGQAVALEDRCAHRSFPLSRSRLEGDGIVCGYHGFRYDSQGELSRHRRRKPVRAASASVTTRFWSAARWSGFGSATRDWPTRSDCRSGPGWRIRAGPAPRATSYTRATT